MACLRIPDPPDARGARCLAMNAETFEYQLRDEVVEWCHTMLTPGWHFSSTAQWDDRFIAAAPLMEFACEVDMAMFVLRWM